MLRRLQVAVDDPQPVRLGDAAGQRLDQRRRPPRRPGGAVEPLGPGCRPSTYSSSRKGRPSASPMWWIWTMLGCWSLATASASAEEADGGDGVGVGAGQDHLQGAGAVQADLPGPVDDPHAAAAELALDLVAGDGRRGAVGRWGVGLGGERRVPDPGRGDGGLVREGHTPGGLARIDLAGESRPERVGGAIRPEVRHRRLGLGLPGSDRLSVPRLRIAHESPLPARREWIDTLRGLPTRSTHSTAPRPGLQRFAPATCVRSGLRGRPVAVAFDQPPPASRPTRHHLAPGRGPLQGHRVGEAIGGALGPAARHHPLQVLGHPRRRRDGGTPGSRACAIG